MGCAITNVTAVFSFIHRIQTLRPHHQNRPLRSSWLHRQPSLCQSGLCLLLHSYRIPTTNNINIAPQTKGITRSGAGQTYLLEGSVQSLPLLAKDPGNLCKGCWRVLFLDIRSLLLAVIHESWQWSFGCIGVFLLLLFAFFFGFFRFLLSCLLAALFRSPLLLHFLLHFGCRRCWARTLAWSSIKNNPQQVT